MSRARKCLAIVPAFNEAEAIAATVAEIRAAGPAFDVLVVDDGSRDDTAAHARAAGARVISLPFNLGIGGAVQTGYRIADRDGYDVAVQVDGDGQHDAAHLNAMLAELENDPSLGMVTGSRFLTSDGAGFRSSASRRAGIRFFSAVLTRAVGRPVTDPTSGLRMVDRRGIELFAREYPHDYPEVEAVLVLHQHGLRAAEVPVVMRARETGASSIGRRSAAYYMVKVSLALAAGMLRPRTAAPALEVETAQAQLAV